jgi:hypothetical protein
MQIGIDSFAAAFDDSSLAVSPQDRLRHLVEQIEYPIRSVWPGFRASSTTRSLRTSWICF